MKQRFSSHMTLIELTSALFVLMLAMATVIRLFTTAYGMSVAANQLTRATQLAQDCAAMLESADDPEALLCENGYESAGEEAGFHKKEHGLTASVQWDEEQTTVGYLYTGTIRVGTEEDTLIYWPAAHYIIRK